MSGLSLVHTRVENTEPTTPEMQPEETHGMEVTNKLVLYHRKVREDTSTCCHVTSI